MSDSRDQALALSRGDTLQARSLALLPLQMANTVAAHGIGRSHAGERFSRMIGFSLDGQLDAGRDFQRQPREITSKSSETSARKAGFSTSLFQRGSMVPVTNMSLPLSATMRP